MSPALKKLLLYALALVIAAAAVSLGYRSNILLTLVLGVAMVAEFAHTERKALFVTPFLVGAVIGPVMEMFIIRAGAWAYSNPTMAGIPLWLPLLWGFTAVYLVKITRLFSR